MTIEQLKAKLDNGHSITVHIYAPAEHHEEHYYKLGIWEHDFKDEEVIGYEFIQDEFSNDLYVIIARPVEFTKVSVTAHFTDGGVYEIHQSLHLQLELVPLYDYWPAHIDYRSGKEWSETTSD